jgi:hypothetical protein
MPVYAVWESHFPPEVARYLAHELIEDLDDPGHLLVVGQWATRQRADEVVREYAGHPNARCANELVSRPRTRFLGHAVSGRE